MTDIKLTQLYANHSGKVSDKWSSYLDEYDRLFEPFKSKQLSLLEIGIQNGGSLEIWAQYFPCATALIGCDIDANCEKLQFAHPRVHIVIGDASAPDTRDRIIQKSPAFDIVIDDGSHHAKDVVRSFANYFPLMGDGGIYLTEDLHCSYWEDYGGGLYQPYSSMAFFKRLADVINHEHWGVAKARLQVLQGFMQEFECHLDSETLSEIHSIEFLNSLCVVRKAHKKQNVLGRQIVTGTQEDVQSGRLELGGRSYDEHSTSDETSNIWSMRDTAPDEAFPEVERRLETTLARVVTLEGEMSMLRTAFEGDLSTLRMTFEDELSTLKLALKVKDSEAKDLSAQIHDIRTSTSWRVTEPLRALKRRAHEASDFGSRSIGFLRQTKSSSATRVRSGAKLLRTHGVRRCLQKAVAITRSEGLTGLRLRLDILKHIAPVSAPSESIRTPTDYDYIAFSIERQKNARSVGSWNFRSMRPRPDARWITDCRAGPMISVLMPVYNTNTTHLAAAISSVIKQIYGNWELIVVDDASTTSETRELLKAYAARDERIKPIFRETNGNISAASNSGLAAASGDFVALLDHDDTLEPNALLEIARVVRLWPEVDYIYTDEDKLSVDGRYHSPSYKPDWSPSFLLSTMYTCHLSVYRTSLIRSIDGFRSEYDGTQDYDLALRATSVTDKVCHIPLILYHWRESPTSTAGNIGNKQYAITAQKRAIDDALRKRGIPGTASPHENFFGNWRIDYNLDEEPRVSIVIPSATRDAEIRGTRVNLALNCVQSICALTEYKNFEIVLVHNEDAPTAIRDACGKYEQIRLVQYNEATFNLANKINLGVRHATGEYIVLLNDDIEVISSDWLTRMVAGFAELDVGVIGAKLLFENSTIQHAGIVWVNDGPTHAFIGNSAEHLGPILTARLRRDVLGVTGACMMVSKLLFEELGGFDSEFPLNYNDVDFCLRVRERGYRIVIDPDVRLFHFESMSKSGLFESEIKLLATRWGNIDDPFYNANYDRSNPWFNPRTEIANRQVTYEDWLEYQVIQKRGAKASRSDIRPTFSLLTTVYDTDSTYLEALADTVFNQTYRNFEWILLDNGSTVDATRASVQAIASRDARVKFVRVETNLGIAGGMGHVLALACNDFVLPIDSDDLITADALEAFAHAITENPNAKAFYSDEDKIGASHGRFAPFFKPDFDEIYFTNCCYIAHLCCLDRKTMVDLKCYSDPATNGCHDWDTFYRFLHAGLQPMHVPAVLYSWRIHPQSTASGIATVKPYTVQSQKSVLRNHLSVLKKSERFTTAHRPEAGTWRIELSGSLTQSVCELRKTFDGWQVYQLEINGWHSSAIKVQSHRTLQDSLEAASKEHDFIFFCDADLKPRAGWVQDGAALLEFCDDAAVVGGRVLRNTTVLCAGFHWEFQQGRVSPYAGLALGAGGHYGKLLNQHRVDAVSALNWGARSSDVKAALIAHVEPVYDMRQFLEVFYSDIHARQRSVIYSPEIIAVWNRRTEPVSACLAPQLHFDANSPKKAFYNPQIAKDNVFALEPIV